MVLIPNNGWETGDAGGWTLGSTGSAGIASVSSLGPRTGTYHLRLGSGSASGGTAFARYEIPTFLTLAGLKVTFRVYSNRVDGVPSTRRIRIDDGVLETARAKHGSLFNLFQLSLEDKSKLLDLDINDS